MNKLFFRSLTLAIVATTMSSAAFAPSILAQSGAPILSPTPDPLYSPPAPQPYTPQSYVHSDPGFSGYSIPQQGQPFAVQPIEMFGDVRYHGTRNIAPGAVPMIVQVPNPCVKGKCCKTCVNVEVCAPPCDPQKVRVTRDGNRIRYDFGKHSVLVKTVGDHVVVHYGD